MSVVAAIMPVITMIVIGIICKKFNFISSQGMGDIKSIIANIMLPVTLFHALGNANYGSDTLKIVLVILIVEVIAMLVGYPLRALVKGDNRKFLPILMTTTENGMLGYPLYIILCGQNNLGNMATLDIAVTAFGFSIWSSMITQIDSGEKISAKRIVKLARTNPCLWGVVLGIAAGISGAMNTLLDSPIGPVYSSVESLIVAPLSTMILIALGYDLVFEKSKIKEVLSSVILRFTVQMILLLGTWFIIGVNASYEMQTAILLFFFLPVAFSSQVYVRKEESKSFIATFASLYSLITIVAFAVLAILR